MPLLLHAGHTFSLTSWPLEPMVVAGAFIALSFYFYAAVSLPGGFVPWRATLYVLGVGIIFLALASPLDIGADRLLSLHMLQHVLLTTVGPPLILLGLPEAMLRPIFMTPSLQRPASLLTHPVFAATLFIVNMWVWHVPPVYDLAVRHTDVHNLMHVTFLATGVLFWWPVIQPTRLTGLIGDGAKLLYLFATGMPMGLLALLFFASNGVIYDYYVQTPPLWGLGPMDDQQIAGLIMGALGEAASFAAITLLFFRFLDHDEEAARAQGHGGAV